MKKILVFGGSNSTTSINRALALYAASQLQDSDCDSLDLNDFQMPIYSPELEASEGVPEEAKAFVQRIEAADGIILSLAEHNGSYAAAFKNVFDWASRHKQKLWSDRPMLIMSTSPGGRGGASVLEAAIDRFPHLGATITASYSLPSFYDNYAKDAGISDPDLKAGLLKAVADFSAAL